MFFSPSVAGDPGEPPPPGLRRLRNDEFAIPFRRQGIPEEMRNARLYPRLPPAGKRAFCFYPMSKRRGEVRNWFALPYDERKELMLGHGKTGRTFAGRVLQVITGSTGLDDFEWGVS